MLKVWLLVLLNCYVTLLQKLWQFNYTFLEGKKATKNPNRYLCSVPSQHAVNLGLLIFRVARPVSLHITVNEVLQCIRIVFGVQVCHLFCRDRHTDTVKSFTKVNYNSMRSIPTVQKLTFPVVTEHLWMQMQNSFFFTILVSRKWSLYAVNHIEQVVVLNSAIWASVKK